MSQHQSNWLQRLAVSAACVLSIAPAVSQAATIGPDPTSSTLNATAGSFAVSTSTVVAPVGFGGGTIYYPTVAGQYGVIAMSPGFTATQSSIAWLGRRLATWGFVVITINTNTTMDQPASRATQLMAALN